MTAAQVQDALSQVREMRNRMIERKRFRGYSGIARAAGGMLALGTAAVISMPFYPHNKVAHADAWGTLALLAFILNLSALLRWFYTDPEVSRDARRLIPVFYTLPPFLVTSVLTVMMLLNGDYEYLVCLWMCGYGLVNLSQNPVLPPGIRVVGLYYVACGVACIMVFRFPFMNPWPMGVVFFIGELWGGAIFYANRTGRTLTELFLRTRKG